MALLRRRCRGRGGAAAPVAAAAAAVLFGVLAAGAPPPVGAAGRAFPGGAFPAYGRFPALHALQCDTGGPTAANGRRGFILNGAFHAAADGVCAAPLTDLSPLLDGVPTARAESARGRHVLRMARDFVPGSDPRKALTRYYPLALSTAGSGGGGGGGGGGARPRVRGGSADARVTFEADVVALLTLQRNTEGGEVERTSGNFEVLSITRTSRGVCRHSQCNDLTAVDTTGVGACRTFNCANGFDAAAANAAADLPSVKARAAAAAIAAAAAANRSIDELPTAPVGTVPVVTYTDTTGTTRYVSMLQTPLLSLGRGVLADATWLNGGGWDLASDVRLTNLHRHQLPPGVDARMGEAAWKLGGGLPAPRERPNAPDDEAEAAGASAAAAAGAADADAPTATSWPSMIAYVFCSGGARAFALNSRLCDGLFARVSPAATVDLDGAAVTTSDEALTLSTSAAFWSIVPAADGGAPPPPPCALDATMAATGPTPPWLAGTRSREINAASAAERALAGRLGRCAFPLLAAAPVDEAAALRATEKAGRLVDLQRLSISYDEAVFAVPPPPPPSTLADVVTAIVLVLPEAVATIVMYLSTRVWRRREVVSLAVIVGTGCVALLSVILLALEEVRGAAWVAASTRDALHVYLSPTAGDCVGEVPHDCRQGLKGSALLLSESLIIIARNGYHPRVLIATAATVGGIYLAGCVWVAVAVACRIARRRSDAKGHASEGEASASTAVGGGGYARPAGVASRVRACFAHACWCRRPRGGGGDACGAADADVEATLPAQMDFCDRSHERAAT
ncbi:hypothetical protein BU14_0742s0008 [Porphyra umbilicalis]|uniref:Uncharacterized protein n=1 Tax=Porphyra umbilicalis TaxID=2786 RepID=A0A1X6NPG8_PORUM|nr:hypothetical protein BU14_0742s0008 [Porphyra umbilicalis]|eukprot:OSX70487.1 hypothetical protein BU14_0742s0008 [Porphyra umbilicalis]